MNLYTLTATARRDLNSIWQYIAKDSERHADIVEEAVLATCRLIADLPGMGHRRRGVRSAGVLFVAVQGFERYSIAYIANSKRVTIVRIVHGARDLPRLFR